MNVAVGATGGTAATGGAPGAAGGGGGAAGCARAPSALVPAGKVKLVSRRISFTFTTIDSQRLFCAATSMVDVAPVVPDCAPEAPNVVEAVDCIFTLREAL